MPDISVVIPSIGRSGVGDLVQAVAPDDRTEVVIVDNTPDRASGLDALAGPHVQVVHEPNAGAARARNRGVAEATGRVVVFVDDDVRMEAGTVDRLAAPVLAGEAGATVGRVELDPDVRIPRWLVPPWLGLLSRHDRGDDAHDLSPGDHGLTAVMAVDREAFRTAGGFWERLGPRPGVQRTNDDVQLCRALQRAGLTIRYVPSARVVHEVPETRTTRRYVLTRAFEQGRSDWLLEHSYDRRPRRDVLGAAWRDFVAEQRGNLQRAREVRSMAMRTALTTARLTGVLSAAINEPT